MVGVARAQRANRHPRPLPPGLPPEAVCLVRERAPVPGPGYGIYITLALIWFLAYGDVTFRGTGGNPFGPGCAVRPWEDGTDSVDMAIKRVRVAFEFTVLLRRPAWAVRRACRGPSAPGVLA